MQLVQEAIRNDHFGLRKRFPWSSESVESNKLQSDICWREEAYLKSLLGSVFRKGKLTIERIENPYLWGRYCLQYEEMRSESHSQDVCEQIMIHATSASCAYSIAEENFNWRLVCRARFGEGVSFTNDPAYATRWATRTSVYVIAGLLVNKSSPGTWNQTIPADGEDTTTGFTEDVCIKYYDNDFYPYYIVQE